MRTTMRTQQRQAWVATRRTASRRVGVMGWFALTAALVLVAVLKVNISSQLSTGPSSSAVSSSRSMTVELPPSRNQRDKAIILPPPIATRAASDTANGRFQSAANHPNDERNINKNTSKELLRFVWHVGPMKTGTTSLQMGLGGMEKSGTLKRDNWVYAQFPSLYSKQRQVFWTDFKTTMDQYKNQGLNVVVSSENFSIYFRESDYKKVKQLLHNDWRVEVVVGYRPYFEWVPSFWSEKHKLRYTEQNQANDPLPEVAWKKGSAWKKPVSPMFPDFHSQIGPLFADSIYKFVSPHLPVTMLHMYNNNNNNNPQQPTPLRTMFVCHILQAPASCERSRQKDNDGMVRRANVKFMDEIHINALVMEAAQRGWIDTQEYSRATLIAAVVDHLTKANATIWDLPFICPDQHTLDKLWNRTVEIEQDIYPQLAASDQREEQLRGSLKKLIVSKTYCHLELTAILNDLEWQTFFSQYSSRSDPRNKEPTFYN